MREENTPFGNVAPLPLHMLESMNGDTAHLFIVWHLLFREAVPFVGDVEKTYYPPGTPSNDDFNMMLHQTFAGMPWWILSVPLRDRGVIELTAHKHGLRLADGVPTLMISAAPGVPRGIGNMRPGKHPMPPAQLKMKLEYFPLRSPRTFGIQRNYKGPADDRPIVSDVVGTAGPIPWRASPDLTAAVDKVARQMWERGEAKK